MQNYIVVIHADPEGGYRAEALALLSCYSRGDSVDELIANIREAASGFWK